MISLPFRFPFLFRVKGLFDVIALLWVGSDLKKSTCHRLTAQRDRIEKLGVTDPRHGSGRTCQGG
jgi:hypothetical protein